MIDLAIVLPWFSLIIGLIAIYGFFKQRRETIMEEGRRTEQTKQLRSDIDKAFEKIRYLEVSGQGADGAIIELKTQMALVLESLKRIENKLDA